MNYSMRFVKNKMNNKTVNQMFFSNDEHKKCYTRLMQIVKDGTKKPTPDMIGNTTEGVPDRIFHKSLMKKEWKVDFVNLIYQKALEWELSGGIIGEKLKLSFKEMIRKGEYITPQGVCKNAKVSSHYLSLTSLNYPWQRSIYDIVKIKENHWIQYGGYEAKLAYKILQVMLNEGKRPTHKALALQMNKDKNYFNKDRLTYPWKQKIVQTIKEYDYEWQRYGGKWAVVIKLTLKHYIYIGKRPQTKTICDDVGYSPTNIEKAQFPWQISLKKMIKDTDFEWQQHGGNNFKKCNKALKSILANNQIPTPANVSKKAGLNSEYLKSDLFPWKNKLLNKIEQSIKAELDEIMILYFDIKILVTNIIESKEVFNDYRNIGISIKDEKSGALNYYCLSQIMYEQYRYIVRSNNMNRLFVDKNSYKEERKVLIDGIIHLSEGMNNSQLEKILPNAISGALWLNTNSYVLYNIDQAKDAFCNYSYYLHRLLKSNDMSYSVAYSHQVGMIKLLSSIVDVNHWEITEDATGLLISGKAPKSNAYHNVAKFTQEDLAYAFGFYFHLFEQLADFILNGEHFPHIIQLPRGSASLLGVGAALITTSYELPKQLSIGINPIDGHILSDDELVDLATKNKVKYHKSYFTNRAAVVEKLYELNNNKTHDKRLQIGKKALDAWFMCMLYLTITNDSILGNYIWSDDDVYELEHNDRKEFVTVKPRAFNKTIRFTLPKVFIPSFKKAINLRRYVLNGHPISNLFFMSGYGKSARVPKSQSQGCMGAVISNNMIEQLDSKLPKVTSRSTRRDGANDVLQSHGVDIALAVLQNKFNTYINHYNGQTSEEIASNMSNLFSNIHHHVLSNNPISERKQSAMGGCDNEDKLVPKTLINRSIEADCNDPKTCIFCEYFISFPEIEEVRKLLSLQYLIENTAYERSKSEVFYEKIMNPWLKRINVILDQMKEQNPTAKGMIHDVDKEVKEEGLLSPYWLDWVKDLDELGKFS